MKNPKIEFYEGIFQYYLVLKGSGGEAPGPWRIFEKINEISNEKSKKLSFMRENSNEKLKN